MALYLQVMSQEKIHKYVKIIEPSSYQLVLIAPFNLQPHVS